jgi:hypothetical protein
MRRYQQIKYSSDQGKTLTQPVNQAQKQVSKASLCRLKAIHR